MKFKKLKNLKSRFFTKENVDVEAEKVNFLEHIGAEEFLGIPAFDKIFNSIQKFSPSGTIVFEDNHEKHFSATTGQILLGEGKKLYIASFKRYNIKNQKPQDIKKYIVFKPDYNIIGAQNVWDKWDQEKTIFVKQNISLNNAPSKSFVSVITSSMPQYRSVRVYDQDLTVVVKDDSHLLDDEKVSHKLRFCYKILNDFGLKNDACTNQDWLHCAMTCERSKQTKNPIYLIEDVLKTPKFKLIKKTVENNLEQQ